MRKIKNEAYRFGTWHNVKKYINRMKAGEVIKRKNLLKQWSPMYFTQYGNPYADEYHTVDVYRRYLTKAGYLKHIGRGLYEKVKSVPIGHSRRDVQREGYNTESYLPGW